MLRSAHRKLALGGQLVGHELRGFRLPKSYRAKRNRVRLVTWGSADANTMNLPAGWQAGDLALVMAHNHSGAVAPSLPGTFTNLSNGAASSTGHRAGYRLLQAGDTTIGTWTNATAVIVVILRGTHQTTPTGDVQATVTASTTTLSFPALTLQDTSGASWVVQLGFTQSGTNANANATDTNSPSSFLLPVIPRRGAAHVLPRTTSWGGATKTMGGSGTTRGVSIEVKTA